MKEILLLSSAKIVLTTWFAQHRDSISMKRNISRKTKF